jgi:hypothetical protein
LLHRGPGFGGPLGYRLTPGHARRVVQSSPTANCWSGPQSASSRRPTRRR